MTHLTGREDNAVSRSERHTEGPWASCLERPERREIITAGNKVICSVWSGGSASPITYGEWIANIRLIAAAPELFEALRVILVEASSRKERGMLGIANIARHALQKATPYIADCWEG